MLMHRYSGAEPQCNSSIIVVLKNVIAGTILDKKQDLFSTEELKKVLQGNHHRNSSVLHFIPKSTAVPYSASYRCANSEPIQDDSVFPTPANGLCTCLLFSTVLLVLKFIKFTCSICEPTSFTFKF